MESESSRKPLIVIAGETASGKSTLALALAERLGGELICADSWTVYKGFDVGTAKPTPEERARVPHHLLDIADPLEGFSAPQFQRLALETIDDILARGKLPLMVGGTGLYIDSVLYGYEFLPAPSPAVRAAYSVMGLAELHDLARKRGLDLSGIDVRNKRRVIRLLETDGQVAQKQPFRPDTLMLAIATDREHLRERVTARVDAMLAAGLEAEVKTLGERYGWEAEPMKGIGYREWQPYFDGTQDMAVTRDRIIAGTLGLAKRQRTWFKRNDSIQWLSTEDTLTQAVAKATSFLST